MEMPPVLMNASRTLDFICIGMARKRECTHWMWLVLSLNGESLFAGECNKNAVY